MTHEVADNPTRPQRLRRAFRIAWRAAVLTVVGVVVVVLVMAGVTNWRGARAAEAIRRELQQRNLPASVDAFRTRLPAIAEADNGARVWRAAMTLADVPLPEGNALPYLGDADAPVLGEPVAPDVAAAVQAFVEQHDNLYRLIAEAQTFERVDLNIRLDLPYPREDIKVPGGLRKLLYAIQFRSLHHQANGRGDEALADLATVLRMNQLLSRNPWSIVVMVRLSLTGAVVNQMEQALSRTEPGSETIQQLRAALLHELDTIDARSSIELEIAAMAENLDRPALGTSYWVVEMEHNRAFDSLREQHRLMRWMFPDKADEWPDLPDPNSLVQRTKTLARRIWWALSPGSHQLRSAHDLRRLIRDWDHAAQPPQEMMRYLNTEGNDSPGWGAMVSVVRDNGSAAVAAQAMAVELHRIKHGRWPESLDELDAGPLADPFDGQPLRYKHTETGCIVYSVGQDQEDDSGVTRVPWGEGDVVFTLLDPERRAAASK